MGLPAKECGRNNPREFESLPFRHTTMNPKLRQALVNFIVWAWPIMPLRLKTWAFLNDGPLKDN